MSDLVDAYRAQARKGETDHWSGPPEMVERIARRLGTSRDDLILDVGCGVGGPARRLAELVGCRVIGVDILRDVLRSAARRPGARVTYVAATADAIPIRSSSVDQAWSLGVVAHLPDLSGAAEELFRVLRSGGPVAVTEVFWEGRGRPRFAATAPKPWEPRTLSSVMSVFESAGFVDIRALQWPGAGIPGAYDPKDGELRRDLRDGRLVPGFVVARRP